MRKSKPFSKPLQVRKPTRRGSSAIELVMTTAVILPLAMLAFYLGVEALQFIFAVDSSLLLSPI